VAERRRAEGTVELRVLVDPKGNVVRTETVQGVDLLTSAALKSVAKWRYRPGFKDGTPVAVWLPVSVRFQLPR
jgi:TonB family protein